MRKILKNRRGMALESAILFLIVIFAFCMLITSMSVVGKYQLKIEKTELENRVRLDQIGEAFVAGELKESYEGFTVKLSADKLTLRVWYGTDSEGTADLTVVLQKINDTTVQVKQWYYTQANQEATGEKTNG